MNFDNEVIHKEIDLIQSCISRMANNSFLLKGWTVSLVAVALVLVKEIDRHLLELILLIAVICFWYLDAFFLRTEKLYREIYKWVLQNRDQTSDYLYDLNPHRFKDNVKPEFCIMFSKTLLVFYGLPCVFLVVAILFIK